MYCMQCGAGLPDDARFCGSCGKVTAQDAGRGSGTGETGSAASSSRSAAIDDIKRTMDEVRRYRKLASATRFDSSDPITAQVIQEGVALHRRALRELDVLIAKFPDMARSADSLKPSLELWIFVDSATFITAMQGLTVPSASAKKLLQEIFPVYAQRGLVDLVKVSGRRLSTQFSPDFVEDLDDSFAVARYLDEVTFTIILEALYRNKLMPIKEHLWESAAYRVGLDATKRAMNNLDSIKRKA